MEVSIETSRLFVVSARKELVSATLDYYNRNRVFHQPWTPIRPEEFYTEAWHVKGIEALTLAEPENIASIRLLMLKKENPNWVIGDIGISNVVRGVALSCNLGYQTDKGELRNGFMFEALSAIVPFVFGQLGLHRIEVNVMPRNTASLNLVRKLGFEKEGHSKGLVKINGKWEDHCRFAKRNLSMELSPSDHDGL